MITIWFFEIGLLEHAPRSFPIACPNLDTARLTYDSLIAGGMIPASTRP